MRTAASATRRAVSGHIYFYKNVFHPSTGPEGAVLYDKFGNWRELINMDVLVRGGRVGLAANKRGATPPATIT